MANYNDIRKDVDSRVTSSQTTANAMLQKAYERSKKAVDARAAKNKADAQANYRQAKEDVNKDLGGASQTTINKLRTNYGRGIATAEEAKGAAMASASIAQAKGIESTGRRAGELKAKVRAETGKAQAQKAYVDKKRKTEMADARKKVRYAQKQQTKQLKYQENRSNIEAFSKQVGTLETVAACNRLIKKLKKSNDPNKATMLAYVRAHKAELKSAKKGSGGGGGGWHSWGGGGWRSYGRSYSGGTTGTKLKLKDDGGSKGDNGGSKSSGKKKSSKSSAYASANKKRKSKEMPHVNPVLSSGSSWKPPKRKSNGKIARTRASGRRHWHQ